MSNVRDELQRWVEGDSWADQGYESELIPVDLARRVLDEMDEQAGQAMLDVNAATHGQELIRQKAIEWRNERDAALATLAEVRAEHQPKSEPCCDCSRICGLCAKECASCEQQSPCDTIRILDRSTP